MICCRPIFPPAGGLLVRFSNLRLLHPFFPSSSPTPSIICHLLHRISLRFVNSIDSISCCSFLRLLLPLTFPTAGSRFPSYFCLGLQFHQFHRFLLRFLFSFLLPLLLLTFPATGVRFPGYLLLPATSSSIPSIPSIPSTVLIPFFYCISRYREQISWLPFASGYKFFNSINSFSGF